MSTYAPVASNRVAAGEPVVVHVVDVGNSNNMRTAYWWEAGPVDTCCCCFSLRTGVGILALLDFLALAGWAFIGMIRKANQFTSALLEQEENEYALKCVDVDPKPESYCENLERNIETLRETDESIGVPIILYFTVAASMTAGVVGLWAFFGSNATAAKLYLWTWPPRYLIREATAFVYRAQLKTNIVFEGINLLVFLYYLKVVWSYQQVLKNRTSGSSPESAGRNLELSTSCANEADPSGNLI